MKEQQRYVVQLSSGRKVLAFQVDEIIRRLGEKKVVNKQPPLVEKERATNNMVNIIKEDSWPNPP